MIKVRDTVAVLSSATRTAATALPVLRGVIEVDQPGIQLLYQNSNDVHEENEVDLLIGKARMRN